MQILVKSARLGDTRSQGDYINDQEDELSRSIRVRPFIFLFEDTIKIIFAYAVKSTETVLIEKLASPSLFVYVLSYIHILERHSYLEYYSSFYKILNADAKKG